MSTIDDVKERLDIVEVIQSYVPLKKAGRHYKGLCPFHTEKTPSFVVFPESGTWHCFGACGTGGDVFTFVMKRENLDFSEALQLLARRAGVELKPPSPQASEAEQRLALLRDINQTAAAYFHHLLLHSDEAANARAYLERRGLNRETIERFVVGYALDQWDGMLRYLTGRRFAVGEIVQAGLAVEREDGSGYYDRFRGRIVFPIRDVQGHVIGFGGRIMGEGVPKYLNSPQTPLFDKSSVLFGLDQAKQGIRLTGEAVIVEGYMDVLMAHQYGISNVVAQMGTALTEAQLKLLKRHTRRFVLALDADVAGDQATLRGLDVVRQVADREVVPVPTAQGLIRFEERLAAEIRIASLPPGLDPDEVIRESPARWAQLMAAAKPVMDFYFQALTAGMDLGTAKGKADAVRALGPLIAELSDRVPREHYLQQLARMVQVDERSLWYQIRQPQEGKPAQRRARAETAREQPRPAAVSLEEYCLSVLLTHPALRGPVDESLRACGEGPFEAGDLDRAEDRAILTAWRLWLAQGSTPEARGAFYDTLDEALQTRLDALIQARERHPVPSDEQLRGDIVDAVLRLRLRSLQSQVQGLRFLLEDARDGEAAGAYGPLIAQLTVRIRGTQRAIMEHSTVGRRQPTEAGARTLA
jgi:DNA primase